MPTTTPSCRTKFCIDGRGVLKHRGPASCLAEGYSCKVCKRIVLEGYYCIRCYYVTCVECAFTEWEDLRGRKDRLREEANAMWEQQGQGSWKWWG